MTPQSSRFWHPGWAVALGVICACSGGAGDSGGGAVAPVPGSYTLWRDGYQGSCSTGVLQSYGDDALTGGPHEAELVRTVDGVKWTVGSLDLDCTLTADSMRCPLFDTVRDDGAVHLSWIEGRWPKDTSFVGVVVLEQQCPDYGCGVDWCSSEAELTAVPVGD